MLKSRFSYKHPNPAISLVVKYNLTALDSNQHCAVFLQTSLKPLIKSMSV